MIIATAGALTIAAWVEPGNTAQLSRLANLLPDYGGINVRGILTTLFSREPEVDTRAADATELALKQRLSATYPRVIAAGMSWYITYSILPFYRLFQTLWLQRYPHPIADFLLPDLGYCDGHYGERLLCGYGLH